MSRGESKVGLLRLFLSPLLSPDPLAQLGLAKTDVHAGADTTNGSGVKLQELKDASFLAKPQATERKK